MLWELYSLINSTVNAGSNVIDKFVLTKWIKNPLNSIIIMGMIQFLVAIVIFSLRGFGNLSVYHVVLALISGVFYILMALFYFKAVQIEEVSRVVPLFSLTPIFVLIFASIFLGEFFTYLQYLGIFILIFGALLLSYKPKMKIAFGKAFWLMMLSIITMAISNIILKYLLKSNDFWTIYAYTRIGIFFVVLPIIYFTFSDLKQAIKQHGYKVIGFISLSESLILIGVFAGIIALSLGPATLVSAFSSIQNFILLGITVLLSVFFPKVIKENIDKATIIWKVIAIVLLFVGVILIS
jgi:bacterial/archaeal transporter family protein